MPSNRSRAILRTTGRARRLAPLVAALAMAIGACGGGGGDATAGLAADGGRNGTGDDRSLVAASESGAPATGTPSSPSAPATTNSPIYGSMRTAALGHGANLGGAIPFPADNAWNSDISQRPVDANSDNLIASIGASTRLFPDFGSGTWNGAPIGIPYVVVPGTQPRVAIHFTQPWGENDPGPYPVPADAKVEGEDPAVPGSGGDRHVLVIDRDNNRLYELYRAFRNGDGSWNAESAALFHLDANLVRPGGQPGWTSADAAGLPIFPGLVRYEEAAAGAIRHALRFTAAQTRKAWVPPANHAASNSTDPNRPPMGMRVRLKAGYVIPGTFSAPTRAILQALKTYGMILADNGSNWYLSGAPDPRWNNGSLKSELGQVKGSDFEVVRMDGLVTP
jgi:hypothetical protein